MTVKKIEVSVSVDGAKEMHNRHRKLKNGTGSWNLIEKNLLEAIKKLDGLKIRMTYTPETVDFLSDSVEKLIRIGIKEIMLVPDYFSEKWDIEKITILKKEFLKIQDLKKRMYGVRIATGNYKETIHKECSKCGGGENTFSITAEGDIYPCTYAVGTIEFRLGSIYDLETIKCGSYPIDASLGVLCKGCRYFRVCYSGRCIYLNYKMTGDLFTPNGFFCAYQKMEYKLVEEGQYE